MVFLYFFLCFYCAFGISIPTFTPASGITDVIAITSDGAHHLCIGIGSTYAPGCTLDGCSGTGVQMINESAGNIAATVSMIQACACDGIALTCQGGIASQPAGIYLYEKIVPFGSGSDYTCGILQSNGSIKCWGHGEYEQVPSPISGSFSSVTAGFSHMCGILRSSGIVTCFGNNTYGQAPPLITGPFSSISAGYQHTCGVLKSNGSVVCWGDNSFYGQAPSLVIGPFSVVSSGVIHACGILESNGNAQCWGWNYYGQAPSLVIGPFSSISAGYYYTCGILRSNGDVKCWGQYIFYDIQNPPPVVSGPFSSISGGMFYVCGVFQGNGSMACWGDIGGYEESLIAPRSAVGPFSAVSASTDHTCSIFQSNGSATCWGKYNYDKAPSLVTGPFIKSLGPIYFSTFPADKHIFSEEVLFTYLDVPIPITLASNIKYDWYTYTTDESTPSCNGKNLTDLLLVSANLTLKAIGCFSEGGNSEVSSLVVRITRSHKPTFLSDWRIPHVWLSPALIDENGPITKAGACLERLLPQHTTLPLDRRPQVCSYPALIDEKGPETEEGACPK